MSWFSEGLSDSFGFATNFYDNKEGGGGGRDINFNRDFF